MPKEAILDLIGPPEGDMSSGVGDAKPATDPMQDAKMMAADDAIAALEAKDSAALSDALQRHYEACAGSE